MNEITIKNGKISTEEVLVRPINERKGILVSISKDDNSDLVIKFYEWQLNTVIPFIKSLLESWEKAEINSGLNNPLEANIDYEETLAILDSLSSH